VLKRSIRKKLGAEGLLKPPCLGFGFEGLDLVADPLTAVRPSHARGARTARGVARRGQCEVGRVPTSVPPPNEGDRIESKQCLELLMMGGLGRSWSGAEIRNVRW
jgi:hypothetical protein